MEVVSTTDTSSEEDAGNSSGRTAKYLVKIPKYDRSTPFESFWAQFQSAIAFHKWRKSEQLCYLMGSLKDPATQVLWDYGEDIPRSLKKLTKVLKIRYGG